MNIFGCLNRTDISYLECISKDNLTSQCICIDNSDDIFKFELLNTDVYNDLNINEVKNINLTDKWYTSNGERIEDCFRIDGWMEWNCKTWKPYLSNTWCVCFSNERMNYIASGDILTKFLYKGLENIPFSNEYRKNKNKINDKMEIIQKKDSQIYNDENIPDSEKHNFLLVRNNFYNRVITNTYLPIFISLFFLGLILVKFIHKNILHRKY